MYVVTGYFVHVMSIRFLFFWCIVRMIHFCLFQARKALRRLKGTVRLQLLKQGYPIQKQAITTLGHLHSWCKIQSQIRARRLCMVTEGRIKQKKLENQQKLEAKLHDIEVRSPTCMCKQLA